MNGSIPPVPNYWLQLNDMGSNARAAASPAQRGIAGDWRHRGAMQRRPFSVIRRVGNLFPNLLQSDQRVMDRRRPSLPAQQRRVWGTDCWGEIRKRLRYVRFSG